MKMLRLLVMLVIAVSLQSATAGPASADAVCEDGSYSYSSGSGTCSWHGGVDYWVTPSHEPLPYADPASPEDSAHQVSDQRKRVVAVGSVLAVGLIVGGGAWIHFSGRRDESK